ncbi:MAG: HEAT repeat domain-containing protein [Cyanobacteria bacterium P01_A01_bin.105]
MTTDALFAQLKHPNPYMRERAMVELAEAQAPGTIEKLLANLGEEDVVYRRASVKTLGVMGAEAVPPVANLLLESDNVTIRSSCAKALAQHALNCGDQPFPQAGLDALKVSVNDENPVVHIASAMALGEIGPAALEIVTDTLAATENLSLAVSLTNALAAIGTPEAAETLKQTAADESADGYVRESANSALSRIDMVSKYSR